MFTFSTLKDAHLRMGLKFQVKNVCSKIADIISVFHSLTCNIAHLISFCLISTHTTHNIFKTWHMQFTNQKAAEKMGDCEKIFSVTNTYCNI